MAHDKAVPPVWLMGLANLPFGMFGAVALITVPQLLAARHVPEPSIASVTAVAMIATFSSFLLAPMLDVRFSRRSYAIAFCCAGALLTFIALSELGNLGRLSGLLLAGFFCVSLFNGALGGWLGSIVPKELDGRLAAWFTIGNVGGFGLVSILGITLLRALPAPWGAAAVALLLLLPLPILVAVPAPSADRRQARESFATLFRDLLALVKHRAVLRTLLLFCLPASSFALTNTLGGLGADFGAPERMVALIAGIGVTGAGVAGSLLARPLAERMPPQLLYLLIGIAGAAFTLSLLALPRQPAVFAIAMIGENVFQSAAFTAANAIIFRGIGAGNPLAATQFTFLTAAYALPVTYMQAIDGQAYAVSGMTSTFAADAGISLVACLLLLPLVRRWSARMPAVPS